MTENDKTKDPPEQLREVHVIEVMETVEHDRELELWGLKEDADKRANHWRGLGRRVAHTVERIRWS
jgi:hypothetical protein